MQRSQPRWYRGHCSSSFEDGHFFLQTARGMTMSPMLEVSTKTDFPALERDLLDWWAQDGIVEKYLSGIADSAETFSFIDGPITANNPMGVHHGWGRTYKDLFQRYHAHARQRAALSERVRLPGISGSKSKSKRSLDSRASATSRLTESPNSSIGARNESGNMPSASPSSQSGSDTGWIGTTPTTRCPTKTTTRSGIF